MPRRKMAFMPGCYYHLYNRGHNRQAIFFGRENYLFFLKRFRHYLAEQTLQVMAYCLMPNHYHFLVCLRESNLSEQMGLLSLSYTKAINRRLNRYGSLFQGPFRAILVNEEAYLLHLSRYIHLNPVKAGLVARAEDWEFSSYPEYVGLRQGTLPQFEAVRRRVGAEQDYRLFVEAEAGRLEQRWRGLLLDE
ncbi:MAG: transposase [Leptolyngbya sp. SIO4C5]|nr:transposase [Leptolyngbya sp. SIO4C5]